MLQGRSTVWGDLSGKQLHHPIWFHCASVGEFEQGLPLLRHLQQSNDQYTFLVSFFSPSGYLYALKRFPDLQISYLPFDTPDNAKKWITEIKPQAAFFIKYEFWYHYLHQLKSAGIPSFLISAHFRPDQPFFKWYGSLHRRMLNLFTHIFVQQESSQLLLQTIGIEHVTISGDTRFDRVTELSRQDFHDAKIEDFVNGRQVFIGGSIWPSDEPVLRQIISALPTSWKIILAPHELSYTLPEWLQNDACLYSNQKNTGAKVMWLDTMGILSRIYRYSHLVYIGGGYGKGIHNTLEAAIYAVPILIGPRYQKFNEAVEMVEAGIAFNTATPDFQQQLGEILQSPEKWHSIRESSLAYIHSNANAVAKISVRLLSGGWLPQGIKKE
jgi:3-deoxy-D-manno-octulosonic-acid transferase